MGPVGHLTWALFFLSRRARFQIVSLLLLTARKASELV